MHGHCTACIVISAARNLFVISERDPEIVLIFGISLFMREPLIVML